MRLNYKFIYLIFLIIFNNNLNCYEIIRDPIFENYFDSLSKELQINNSNVFLTRSDSANAFVINDKIYFTTGFYRKSLISKI